ncbi:MAG: tRNA uridine-5-carboxymethylaminomethyl(34) synthesis enzyme MnmG [Helicobacter sp.]|nr:tRNA uridine-5-carboxymethylaminomethyl(34) synthesis enzyme MnmG [Helicobacter sp.]
MKYDVIVIGGGHAGIEAAHIAAKMGARVLLLTMLVEQIGAASCNPAVGGLGKGHLVKEIDALGGVMGYITDKSGIQFRTLNASKGPAVRGTRAQIDMDRYKILARDLLYNTKNLEIAQLSVESLILNSEKTAVCGVKTSIGKEYFAKKVILTTGTFLRGKIHIGENTSYNGRAGEPPAKELGENLRELGLDIGRLKTGTCARIRASSIDFSNLEKHYGDTPAPYFSKRTQQELGDAEFKPTQLPCFVTYTNKNSHKIIRDNFHRAPMFTGQIEGVGPRYCPSIEDKVNRFSDKERHQLFLEPQTLEANEYYINGLTTSLPFSVQEELIRSIDGLENAEIVRYGYAIEYDYVNPTELKHTLETKKIKNLYCAGQINGTTGYEEAGAQGIFAGINAALSAKGQDEITLRRDEAYIGVLVDDLVTKGTKEPYRMFSSRAEYRLILREGNAIFRLGEIAYKLGLMEEAEFRELQKDIADIAEAKAWLDGEYITPNSEFLGFLESIGENKISDKCALSVIVARRSFELDKFLKLLDFIGGRKIDDRKKRAESGEQNEKVESKMPEFSSFSKRALEELLVEIKYSSYIKKQESMIANMDKMLSVKIPPNFDYDAAVGLGLEVIEKLKRFQPKSLFEASEISGVTPASLEVLQLYVHFHNKK